MVTMEFVESRVGAKVIAIAVLLLGSLAVPVVGLMGDAEAAPNPIPICSVRLYPSELRATVDHGTGDTVTFGGNCTVDQMNFITSTVTLAGVVDKGWAIQLSTTIMEFSGPGTKRFTVVVTVPAGVPDDETADVIVNAECKAPIIAPVSAATSAVITVKNTSPNPDWDIRILDPAPNEVYTTDGLTIMGSACSSPIP